MKNKAITKFLLQALVLFGVVAAILASGAAFGVGGNEFFIALFIGFFAVIVVFQLIPSLFILCAVIWEVFTGRPNKIAQRVRQDKTN